MQGRAGEHHSPVPNFKQLHAAWNSRLADCKAVNRSKSTKPEVPRIACLSSSDSFHAASPAIAMPSSHTLDAFLLVLSCWMIACLSTCVKQQ